MYPVDELFTSASDGELPTSPKQYLIGEVTADLVIQLNSAWHSLLPHMERSNLMRSADKVFYAAAFANRFYAVAAWTHPTAANRLARGHVMLELRRFAIAPEACRNTASYMLGWMRRDIAKRMPHIETLISYQDSKVHLGTIYKAANWKAISCGNDWAPRTDGAYRAPPQTVVPKVRWEIPVR